MRDPSALLATLILAGLCAAGCRSSTENRKPSEAPAAVSPPAPLPPAAPPVAETTEPDTILSVLSVEHEVDLLAQRDGSVVEILHDDGDRVEKGELLGRLDDRELVAKMDRARADLQVAEMNVKYNEAEVKARQAAYRRAQEMHKLGLNSDADLEEAEFKAKGAQYDLESWHAVVERNRAAVRELEVQLEQTRVRAPFGGVVARRYLRSGQNVTKNEKCFRVSQLGPLLVRFQVLETSSRHPHPGETVEVRVLRDNRHILTARIQRVSTTVDPASGSYDVTAQLIGPNLKDLRPGMAVRVVWKPVAAGREP
jgi:RND family efflux transporter MFP subunit